MKSIRKGFVLPRVFVRILNNMALLMGSSSFAAVLAIVALGLNTRSLGPADFGSLSLIQAYAAFIAGITALESWQPVVRLGLRVPKRIGLVLASGIMLDAIAAASATIIALGGVFLFGNLIGIAADYQDLVAVYCLSLLAGLAGTPKGFFRLRQRFDVLAGNQASLALAMTTIATSLWWLGASLQTYVILFALAAVIYNISLFVRMIWTLRQEGIRLPNPLATKRNRRIVRVMIKMVVGSSALSTFSSSRRHIALFIVGSTLSETAAGLFAVAARLVMAVAKLSSMVNQVLFSEVLEGSSRVDKKIWPKLVRRLTIMSSSAAMLLMIVGVVASDLLVRLAGGEEYIGAAPIFSILLAAECIGLAAVHLNPVIQAKSGTLPLVFISAVSTLLYVPFAILLSGKFGAEGVAVAVVISAICSYLLMLQRAARLLRMSTEAPTKVPEPV